MMLLMTMVDVHYDQLDGDDDDHGGDSQLDGDEGDGQVGDGDYDDDDS